MFLFDTDVITNILKPKPSPILMKRLSETPSDHQFISVVTISEIVYGACKSERKEYHLHNLEHVLLPQVNILDFDTGAAYVAGHIRAELEKMGQPLAFADIQVASIAMSRELTLVTGNLRHFNRIAGLRVANWLTTEAV